MPESASTPKKRDRKEATHYALGARIRTAILTILNDGPASHSELAKLTGLSYGAVGHHIKAMMVDGSIELAAILSVRNQNVHVYRAVKRAYTSDEEAEQASPEENNELAAFIIQGFTAEALCALWAGKLDASKRQVKMSWDMFNVDPETRDKIHQEQLESYERIEQLAGEGINNLAESGEKGVPMIVGSFGFDRSRNTRTPYPLEVKAD